jgi:VanZ family protein
MATIFYLSSLSEAPLPEGVSDKSAHWLGYAGLATVVVRALAGGLFRRIDLRVATLAPLITIAYGVSDELHQLFVPGRTAELYDLVADASGAVIATVAWWAWGIIWARGHTRGPSRDEL